MSNPDPFDFSACQPFDENDPVNIVAERMRRGVLDAALRGLKKKPSDLQPPLFNYGQFMGALVGSIQVMLSSTTLRDKHELLRLISEGLPFAIVQAIENTDQQQKH